MSWLCYIMHKLDKTYPEGTANKYKHFNITPVYADAK